MFPHCKRLRHFPVVLSYIDERDGNLERTIEKHIEHANENIRVKIYVTDIRKL